MSKRLNKKSRIGLSAAAGLLAASGSIAPLTMSTSCSENKTKNSAIDKEYGVTKETYEDLKEQFRIEYSQKLVKIYDVKSEDYKIRMEALEQDLSNFDKIANVGKTPYTALTQVLVDFAREHNQKYPTGNATETEPYGIRLTRHTRTKWSDLNDLYAGVADSIKTYMHNSKMPASTINRIMVESKAKFDNLTKQLKATYGNDALAGLIHVKQEMINFFDEVNDDIALISSCLRLKDFMSEFAFEYKDYNEDGTYYLDNCFDTLKNDKNFQVGNILTNELMNKIFKVTRKTTGKAVPFDAKTLVPGYTIQPKLVAMNDDNLSNTHTINIDFGIVKNVYAQKYAKDPEKLAMVTGHIFNLDQTKEFNLDEFGENSTLADFIRATKPYSYQYIGKLTPKAESDALKDAYFNQNSEDGNISFKWTTNKDEQAYEAFFDNARQNKDGTWTGTLNAQSLANAGLKISNDNNSYSLIKDNKEKKSRVCENLKDLFFAHCSIASDVNIVEGQQKVVTHNFNAFYANSIYNIKNEQGKAAAYPLKESEYENKCVDFKTSDAFYEKINNKFNDVAQFVNTYNSTLKNVNKSTNELKPEDKAYLDNLNNRADELFLTLTISLTVFAFTIGFQIVVFLANPKKKLWIGIGILLLLAQLAAQIYFYTTFRLNYYNKVKEHIKNVKEANKELEQSNLMSMLKKDLNENFVLINDDGTYDKVLFANQKAKFEKNSMSDMLNMYRKYSTINQYDDKDATVNTEAQNARKEFGDILDKHNISPDVILTGIGDWETGGKMWWLSVSIDLFTNILNIALTFVYEYFVNKEPVEQKNVEVDKSIGESVDQSLKEQEVHYDSDYVINTIMDNLKNNQEDIYICDWKKDLDQMKKSIVTKNVVLRSFELAINDQATTIIDNLRKNNEITLEQKFDLKLTDYSEEVFKKTFGVHIKDVETGAKINDSELIEAFNKFFNNK